MSSNARVRVIAIMTLLLCFGGSIFMNANVAASVGRNELSYTDRAEDGDPPQVAIGIAMGALRGLFVNYLWIRATDAKENGRYFEAVELARQITRLQPRFPRVWVFHAWNLAYNISVTTQTPEERWQWVSSGVNLLRDEGIRANPNDMFLHKELGWIFLHKIGGYTDDSNMYYKRQVAYEWTNVMGSRPEVEPGKRDRASVMEVYINWVQDVVDAPDTRKALRAESPGAADILDAFEASLGETADYNFLRRNQLYIELERAGQLRFEADETGRVGPKTRAFTELREQFTRDSDWQAATLHVRKRVLIDKYNMEPVRMVQTVRKYGPMDWRLASSHALYWAARGTDVGRMEVTFGNADALDFVNSYRIVLQSVQDLWRFGDMYFSYLEVHKNRAGVFFVAPNEYFVPTYGGMLEEVVEASGLFEAERRSFRPFAAGYENFLRDAIRYFYRRGDYTNANYWYDQLRVWGGQNINDMMRPFEMSLSLKDFADKQLFDSYGSPQVATSEVYGGLQAAYLEGLLNGDLERFRGLFTYSQNVHAYYMRQHPTEVVASQQSGRVEFMDRDFTFVAGLVLTNVVGMLGPEEAESLYGNSPEDLRRYAYDAISLRFRDGITFLAARNESEPFDVLFPEPPGMEAHRAMVESKIQGKETRGVDGIMKD
ncbi:MAG: hypothetical protein AB8F26_08690 [Phycisphaerales bacterium]